MEYNSCSTIYESYIFLRHGHFQSLVCIITFSSQLYAQEGIEVRKRQGVAFLSLVN